MTIQLPGLFGEIAPSFDAFKNIGRTLINPNYEQQDALRKALMNNPALAQQLTDMGPGAADKMFGNGASAVLPSLPVSLKKTKEDSERNFIGEILALPDGDPKKEEFKAKAVGVSTPAELQEIAQKLALGQAAVDRIPFQKEHDKQTLAAGTQESQIRTNTIAEGNKKVADDQEGDAALANFKLRTGKSPLELNTWKASRSGAIQGAELASLLKNKEFKEKYDKDFQDSYHQQEIAIRQEMADKERKGLSTADLVQRAIQVKSADLAIRHGVDPAATAYLFGHNTDLEKYSNMDTAPTDPAQLTLWRAAKVIKDQNKKDGTAEALRQHKEFRITTQKDFDIINSPTIGPKAPTDGQRKAAIVRINNEAKVAFGDGAPQWHYDVNPAAGSDMHKGNPFKDAEKVLYKTGGDDRIFGTDEPTLPKYQPSTDPFVETVAQDIANGKTVNLAKYPDKAAAVQERVKQILDVVKHQPPMPAAPVNAPSTAAPAPTQQQPAATTQAPAPTPPISLTPAPTPVTTPIAKPPEVTGPPLTAKELSFKKADIDPIFRDALQQSLTGKLAKDTTETVLQYIKSGKIGGDRSIGPTVDSPAAAADKQLELIASRYLKLIKERAPELAAEVKFEGRNAIDVLKEFLDNYSEENIAAALRTPPDFVKKLQKR